MWDKALWFVSGFPLYTTRQSHLPRVIFSFCFARPPRAALSGVPIHQTAQFLHSVCPLLSPSPAPPCPGHLPHWPRWRQWTPNGSSHSPLPCGLCPSNIQKWSFQSTPQIVTQPCAKTPQLLSHLELNPQSFRWPPWATPSPFTTSPALHSNNTQDLLIVPRTLTALPHHLLTQPGLPPPQRSPSPAPTLFCYPM